VDVSCLQSGDCVVLSNVSYYVCIGVFVLAGLLLLLLFFLMFWTPAATFFLAKLRKKSLIYLVNRGQRGVFRTAKDDGSGIGEVGGVGPFVFSEKSHTIEKKSGLSLYFAFAEFAFTTPLAYAALVQKLRSVGLKMDNVDDLAGLVKWFQLKGWSDAKFADKFSAKDVESFERFSVELRPYETVKLHELAYMFPFNVTPANIESRTEHRLAKKLKLFNLMTPQFVMMFIMILIAGVLAAVIAWKFLGADSKPVEVVVKQAGLLAADVVSNVSG
jgi:hypothetical protein